MEFISKKIKSKWFRGRKNTPESQQAFEDSEKSKRLILDHGANNIYDLCQKFINKTNPTVKKLQKKAMRAYKRNRGN